MIKIRDVGLIASLYSHGFEASEVITEQKQVFFLFADNADLKGAITLYNVGKLEVNAKINNDWYKRILYEIRNIINATNENNNAPKQSSDKDTPDK